MFRRQFDYAELAEAWKLQTNADDEQVANLLVEYIYRLEREVCALQTELDRPMEIDSEEERATEFYSFLQYKSDSIITESHTYAELCALLKGERITGEVSGVEYEVHIFMSPLVDHNYDAPAGRRPWLPYPAQLEVRTDVKTSIKDPDMKFWFSEVSPDRQSEFISDFPEVKSFQNRIYDLFDVADEEERAFLHACCGAYYRLYDELIF